MSENQPAATDLRDRLALDRTRLANERTLLAYARTAIMLAATGGTLVAVPMGVWGGAQLGWTLIAAGALLAAVGFNRFTRMASTLN